MMEIMILELFSVVSLVFWVIALLFNVSELRIFLLFLYVLGISMVFLGGKLRDKRMILLPILLFLPFFLEITWTNGFITGFYTLAIYYYQVKILGRRYIDDLVTQFKVVYALMFIITIMGLFMPRLNSSIMQSLPFMLIYFFTTIILSSSLRHKAAGIDPRKNRQNLIIYLGLAVLFSLFVGIGPLRQALFHVVNLLLEGLKSLLYVIIYPGLYAASWLMTKLMNLISIPQNMEYEEEEVLGQIEEGVTQTAEKVKESPIVEILLIVMVVVVTLFFIYRYIKAMREKNEGKLPYKEERSFIMETTGKNKRKRREKMPMDSKGQIRFYYRKYLRQVGKEIPLEQYDTSLSIQEKTNNRYKHADQIRKLYIKNRYTSDEVKRKDVEEMKNLLRD